MPFILVGIILLLSCGFKDTGKEELEKDKKDWKRIMGRDY